MIGSNKHFRRAWMCYIHNPEQNRASRHPRRSYRVRKFPEWRSWLQILGGRCFKSCPWAGFCFTSSALTVESPASVTNTKHFLPPKERGWGGLSPHQAEKQFVAALSDLKFQVCFFTASVSDGCGHFKSVLFILPNMTYNPQRALRPVEDSTAFLKTLDVWSELSYRSYNDTAAVLLEIAFKPRALLVLSCFSFMGPDVLTVNVQTNRNSYRNR